MEKLGRIAENQTELIDQVQTLVADHGTRARLAVECRNAAHAGFTADRTVPEVVLEWLEGV